MAVAGSKLGKEVERVCGNEEAFERYLNAVLRDPEKAFEILTKIMRAGEQGRKRHGQAARGGDGDGD